MKDFVTSVRNTLIRVPYRWVLKPIFFRMDPEDIHDHMLTVGGKLGKYRLGRGLARLMFGYAHPMLEQDILGIHFKNPIGLAAGFDKNAELTAIMPHVGFGFEEVGSITGEPCDGNPKPRLWRLKKSKALVVNYGLKSDGCLKVAERLKQKQFMFPVGTNIAKTNCAETCETDQGVADYVKSFQQLVSTGSYFTINISCPNAFGGQPFTDPVKLEQLLLQLDLIATTKPIFLKLSPDLSEQDVDAILAVVAKHRVQGFICSNLTKPRTNEHIIDDTVPVTGGISGKVVEDLANKLIQYIYHKTKGKYTIIGCGGVFSAEDAYLKIRLGASLVQLITGMIYQGPQVISDINKGLVRLLKKDGFKNISEAVGVDNRY